MHHYAAKSRSIIHFCARHLKCATLATIGSCVSAEQLIIARLAHFSCLARGRVAQIGTASACLLLPCIPEPLCPSSAGRLALSACWRQAHSCMRQLQRILCCMCHQKLYSARQEIKMKIACMRLPAPCRCLTSTEFTTSSIKQSSLLKTRALTRTLRVFCWQADPRRMQQLPRHPQWSCRVRRHLWCSLRPRPWCSRRPFKRRVSAHHPLHPLQASLHSGASPHCKQTDSPQACSCRRPSNIPMAGLLAPAAQGCQLAGGKQTRDRLCSMLVRQWQVGHGRRHKTQLVSCVQVALRALPSAVPDLPPPDKHAAQAGISCMNAQSFSLAAFGLHMP